MTDAARSDALGFSMMFPPGWREFGVDVDSERQVVELATRSARSIGRADVVTVIRQHVHRMFENMRRRGALAVHLPVAMPNDDVLPASLLVIPVRVPEGSTLSAVVEGRSGGRIAERLGVDGDVWYRWRDDAEEFDGDREAGSSTLHYVIPRPGEADPRAALHLLYATVMLTEDRDADYAASLIALGHAIVGTFSWSTRGGPQ